MRFLLSRRWLVFAVVVALLAWLATQLGDWQFRRLHERKSENARIARNVHAAPLPVGDVLRVGGDARADQEWRLVTATGHWDPAHQVVIRYQTREADGAPGVNVVAPLRTSTGPALLVNTGWLGTENVGTDHPRLPRLTPGLVTVSGFVRRNATGDSTIVTQRSSRAVSSEAIGRVLPYPVYGGFLQLSRQTPPAHAAPQELPLPDPGDGPHMFYGIQWWFFGALAIGGFCYLAWDEFRRRRRRGPNVTGSAAVRRPRAASRR